LGFVGITDPPRDEIKQVLQMTEQAGIQTVMVTGDNPLTARAVAYHIGLIHDGEAIVTGEELKRMSDEELMAKIDKVRIFARITPHDKLRIVKLFQKRGEIVTVTGDGVNDALAIKQGDTGVAMGITGTDVAKEVADMVITDDNFASIVSAIAEGRVIFDNMVKSITYLVSTNLGEILLILYTIVASLFLPETIPTPLLAVHILWINLVTDGLPALSLAFDPGTPQTMERRTNMKNSRLLGQKNLAFMFIRGITISALAFTVFLTALQYAPVETARLLTFNTLVFLQLVTIFLIRPGQSLFSNKILLLSILLSFSLQIMVMFVPPFPTIFQFVIQ
jgi:Ca2+-transporting ATPase